MAYWKDGGEVPKRMRNWTMTKDAEPRDVLTKAITNAANEMLKTQGYLTAFEVGIIDTGAAGKFRIAAVPEAMAKKKEEVS